LPDFSILPGLGIASRRNKQYSQRKKNVFHIS
jgi:hypothetical protein